MLWDILIAAGVAITQLIITWYGVSVSFQEKRLRIAIIIGLVGGLGIGLTIWGVIRSGTTQTKLEADITELKNGQQMANAGIKQIENTPPTVTVPVTVNEPSQIKHTSLHFMKPELSKFPFLPFHAGQQLVLNMGFINSGDFAILNVKSDHVIVLTDIKDINHVFAKHRKELNPKNISGQMNAHIGVVSWHTYFGPTLTDDDIPKLNSQEKAVCGLGIAYWKDESGNYETDMSQCFVVGESWDAGAENDRERKLR